jgi:hypothetical protein
MHHNHGTLTTALAALDPEISSAANSKYASYYFQRTRAIFSKQQTVESRKG